MLTLALGSAIALAAYLAVGVVVSRVAMRALVRYEGNILPPPAAAAGIVVVFWPYRVAMIVVFGGAAWILHLLGRLVLRRWG